MCFRICGDLPSLDPCSVTAVVLRKKWLHSTNCEQLQKTNCLAAGWNEEAAAVQPAVDLH